MKMIVKSAFRHDRAIFYVNKNPLDNRLENLTFCENEITIKDDYAIIKSSCGNKSGKIDLDMIGFFKEYTWSIRDNGYVFRRKDRKSVYFHNFVEGVEDSCKEMYVDHINRDPSDNRSINLRKCTNLQNQFNKEKPRISNSTSKHKGVSWCDNKQAWRARYTLHGKENFLGFYTTEDIAASVYNSHIKELHGEFAVLNDVPDYSKEDIKKSKLERSNMSHTNLKGISYHIHSKRWYARYMHDGKEQYVGTFKTEKEAAIAYNNDVISKGFDRDLNVIEDL